MNDYERLIARVKEVNRELAMLQMTAFGQVIESTNAEEENWNEGSASALQAAKELVEKVVEEFPDKSSEADALKHVYNWLVEKRNSAFEQMEGEDGDKFVMLSTVYLVTGDALAEVFRRLPRRAGGATVVGSGQ